MVHYCCCFGCNEKFVKGGKTTFHSFPKDETTRNLWIRNIRRQDFMPSGSSKVCSKHFTEKCFDREKFGGVWLKKGAVPTVFNFPQHLTPKVTCRKSPVKRRFCNEPLESHNQVHDVATTAQHAGTIEVSGEPSITPPAKHCRYLGDFREEDMNSPTKARKTLAIAQKQMTENRRHIRVLQNKNVKYKRKTLTLSSLLEELRQKVNLSQDACSVLQTAMPGPAKHLLLRALPGSEKGTDVTLRAASSSSFRASSFDRPPVLRKAKCLPESDETKGLSTTELHRLVLLEQLKLTRIQMEKEAMIMNLISAKMKKQNSVQQEENVESCST